MYQLLFLFSKTKINILCLVNRKVLKCVTYLKFTYHYMLETLRSNSLSITNIIYLGNIIIFLTRKYRYGNVWMTQNCVICQYLMMEKQENVTRYTQKIYFLLSMDIHAMSEKPT